MSGLRNASHKLRRPLDNIFTSLKQLKERAGICEELHEATKSCEKALCIVNELLCYDHLASGSWEPKLKEVLTVNYLRELFTPWSQQAKDRGIDFKYFQGDVDLLKSGLWASKGIGVGVGSGTGAPGAGTATGTGAPGAGHVADTVDLDSDPNSASLQFGDFMFVDKKKMNHAIGVLLSHAMSSVSDKGTLSLKTRFVPGDKSMPKLRMTNYNSKDHAPAAVKVVDPWMFNNVKGMFAPNKDSLMEAGLLMPQSSSKVHDSSKIAMVGRLVLEISYHGSGMSISEVKRFFSKRRAAVPSQGPPGVDDERDGAVAGVGGVGVGVGAGGIGTVGGGGGGTEGESSRGERRPAEEVGHGVTTNSQKLKHAPHGSGDGNGNGNGNGINDETNGILSPWFAKTIIEMHGGSVVVASEGGGDGKGVVIVIELPMYRKIAPGDVDDIDPPLNSTGSATYPPAPRPPSRTGAAGAGASTGAATAGVGAVVGADSAAASAAPSAPRSVRMSLGSTLLSMVDRRVGPIDATNRRTNSSNGNNSVNANVSSIGLANLFSGHRNSSTNNRNGSSCAVGSMELGAGVSATSSSGAGHFNLRSVLEIMRDGNDGPGANNSTFSCDSASKHREEEMLAILAAVGNRKIATDGPGPTGQWPGIPSGNPSSPTADYSILRSGSSAGASTGVSGGNGNGYNNGSGNGNGYGNGVVGDSGRGREMPPTRSSGIGSFSLSPHSLLNASSTVEPYPPAARQDRSGRMPPLNMGSAFEERKAGTVSRTSRNSRDALPYNTQSVVTTCAGGAGAAMGMGMGVGAMNIGLGIGNGNGSSNCAGAGSGGGSSNNSDRRGSRRTSRSRSRRENHRDEILDALEAEKNRSLHSLQRRTESTGSSTGVGGFSGGGGGGGAEVSIERLGSTAEYDPDPDLHMENLYPYEEAVTSPKTRVRFTDPSSARSLKLLIVDDSIIDRRLLCNDLLDLGHTCDEAKDGLEALALASASTSASTSGKVQGPGQGGVGVAVGGYDAILMDFDMPNMDGPTATQALRDMGFEGIVLGMVGKALPRDIERFKESGVSKVFTKPLNIDVFQQTMKSVLI
jgi:CheY-like chemotaxis protein